MCRSTLERVAIRCQRRQCDEEHKRYECPDPPSLQRIFFHTDDSSWHSCFFFGILQATACQGAEATKGQAQTGPLPYVRSTLHRRQACATAIANSLHGDSLMGNALSKPLRRSQDHKLIAGVCGGFADWLGWDPTAVRAIYVLASLLSVGFPGILAYIIL